MSTLRSELLLLSGTIFCFFVLSYTVHLINKIVLVEFWNPSASSPLAADFLAREEFKLCTEKASILCDRISRCWLVVCSLVYLTKVRETVSFLSSFD